MPLSKRSTKRHLLRNRSIFCKNNTKISFLLHFRCIFDVNTSDMNIFFYLVLHIAGLSTMAGTAVVDFFCYQRFWKQYPTGKEKAAVILPLLATFRFLFAGGFLLLLISGIAMVALSHGL